MGASEVLGIVRSRVRLSLVDLVVQGRGKR
jgi:hypothetical protein